ncbi:helix-turn-helix domain-containing protein [Streptomyces sp. NPDC102383]|uniref:helix-turn-helix domain-containing protein n=1 Tax=unclassified Streptomyces TaxID=2593676 RepID=UPI00381D8314
MSAKQTSETAATVQGQRRCTECGCHLSSYNTTDQCSACSRTAWHAEPTALSVPPHVWQNDDVRDALMQRDFGTLCRLIRERGQLRQEDMAALTDLSQSFLSLLETGRRRLTNIDRIISLLDGLDAPREVIGPMLLPLVGHSTRCSTRLIANAD